MNAHAQLATPTQLRLHQERQARLARLNPRRKFISFIGNSMSRYAVEKSPERLEIERQLAEERELRLAAEKELGELIRPSLVRLVVPFTDAYRARLIVKSVAKKHGVSRCDLLSNRRQQGIVAARQEAMHRIWSKLPWSYPKIGRFFDRDHTTVMHAVRKHTSRVSPKGVEFTCGDPDGARDAE